MTNLGIGRTLFMGRPAVWRAGLVSDQPPRPLSNLVTRGVTNLPGVKAVLEMFGETVPVRFAQRRQQPLRYERA